MKAAALLLTAALAAPGAAAAAPRFDLIVLPVGSYSKDDGVGAGAFVGLRRPVDPAAEGEQRPWITDTSILAMLYFKPFPVAWGVAAKASWFPDPHGRTEVRTTLSTHGWNWDWWFGVGNDRVRDEGRRSDDDEVTDAWHRFGLHQLRWNVELRQRFSGQVGGFVGVVLTANGVELRDNTLAAQQQDTLEGSAGGLLTTLQGGLRVDSRDQRHDPTSGGVVLLMAEATASSSSSSSGGYGRFLADARGFLSPPGASIVLAGEIAAQVQPGQVPFYEYSVLAGPEPRPRTLTGVDGLRGLDRGRVRGPLSLMLHGELRFRPPGFHLKSLLLRLEPIVFADGARADRFDLVGAGPPLHLGLGGGLRVAINEQVLARLDVGAAPDQVRTAAGQLEQRWGVGVYGTINQSF